MAAIATVMENESRYDIGVAQALRSTGQLQSAFSVRTLALFERLPEPQRASYLSGVVIGEELRSRPMAVTERVVVIGEPALTHRYERALAQIGIRAEAVGARAAWCGLHRIAQRIQP